MGGAWGGSSAHAGGAVDEGVRWQFLSQEPAPHVQFAVTFQDELIVVSLIRQWNGTHFIVLIPPKDRLQRDYYAQIASAERWSVRTVRERIESSRLFIQHF